MVVEKQELSGQTSSLHTGIENMGIGGSSSERRELSQTRHACTD